MLDEVDCDIVATGTYFAGRGPVLIDALTRGKHVIGDKPLCTKMADLDRIEALAGEKGPQGRLYVDHARLRLRLSVRAT